jgi:N-methylhydantoinase A
MAAQGVRRAQLRTAQWADLRYRGQSFELKVPLTPRFIEDFHREHQRNFGYANRDATVELVNLRLAISTAEYAHRPRRIARGLRAPAPIDRIDLLADGQRRRSVPVYQRDQLGGGLRIDGPLLLVELSATAFVSADFAMRVDDFGNIHLEARP